MSSYMLHTEPCGRHDTHSPEFGSHARPPQHSDVVLQQSHILKQAPPLLLPLPLLLPVPLLLPLPLPPPLLLPLAAPSRPPSDGCVPPISCASEGAISEHRTVARARAIAMGAGIRMARLQT
jgi:hypothetical protein